MSKNKKILTMLARGGVSQNDITSILRCSKRDVSTAARVLKEHGLSLEDVEVMDAVAIDELLFPKAPRVKNEFYLQPELDTYVERKKKNRRIPVKQFWGEYCALATHAGLMSYSYQTFCEMFSELAERTDAKKHFTHDPGAKAYIDWALSEITGKAHYQCF